MKTLTLIASSLFLSMAVACTSEAEPPTTTGEQTSPVTGGAADPADQPPPPAPAPSCTPIAAAPAGGAIGLGNPAAANCLALGYEIAGDQCTFPDATSCEQWAFFRGQCGQAHSFCNLHGGSVANKVEDMGGWTASYALCTLPGGQQCHEDAFARSCACE